jgi:hypothetical protein
MAVICVHLRLSAVNYKIEIIPACLLSAHALSMGWKWSVRAVASGVGDCCRRYNVFANFAVKHLTAAVNQRVSASICSSH